MSNTLNPPPGALTYCPDCADVFGTLDRRSKRCSCERSQGLVPWEGGDFATPFEICWYCQAEIITSGSRWSVYFCDWCRTRVTWWNNELEAAGQVSLPIGRHSMQHVKLRSARPFIASATVWEWRTRRLRAAWTDMPDQDPEWTVFAGALRRRRSDGGFAEVVSLVQDTPSDVLAEALRQANGLA